MASGRDYPLEHSKIPIPSTVMFLGTTMTGKSTLHFKLYKYKNHVFDPVPVKMVYCYGEVSPLVGMIEAMGHETHYGLPSFDYLEALPKPAYVGIDDLMLEATEEYLTALFTRKAHHLNLSVGFISQDVFNKVIRVARQNTTIIFLTRAENNKRQVRDLGAQQYPGELDFFMSAYRDATSEPYGYLVINNHPNTPNELRLQTHWFPDEGTNGYAIGYPDVFLKKAPKMNR